MRQTLRIKTSKKRWEDWKKSICCLRCEWGYNLLLRLLLGWVIMVVNSIKIYLYLCLIQTHPMCRLWLSQVPIVVYCSIARTPFNRHKRWIINFVFRCDTLTSNISRCPTLISQLGSRTLEKLLSRDEFYVTTWQYEILAFLVCPFRCATVYSYAHT